MTAKMRAAIANSPNEPFRLVEIDRPRISAHEVLIRVASSGLNPLDIKIHAGAAPHARQPLPAVLGLDLAGTVEVAGSAVARFRPGDQVYGMTGGVGGIQGTLAEFAAVDPNLLALKPKNLSMREAAALPLVAITAWEGLVDRLSVSAGRTVLIQGGAGGVGHISLQLAQAFRAKVFATGSPGSRKIIEGLGAIFIDRFEPIEKSVECLTCGKGFDLVYDTAGGQALDASFQAVRQFGHVASCLGWGRHELAPLSFKGASYSGVFTLEPLLSGEGRCHQGEILEKVTELVEGGKIRPILSEEIFGLNDVDAAYERLRKRSAPGKFVVDLG